MIPISLKLSAHPQYIIWRVRGSTSSEHINMLILQETEILLHKRNVKDISKESKEN